MARYVILERPSGGPVWVNPDLVRTVARGPREDAALIKFDDEHSITVAHSPGDAVSRLSS